ncbi:MAG: hypothetical protein ABW168_18000, partial [Sedimenticola sp.]
GTKSEVKPQYKLLDKALSVVDYNEPVFFYENIHIEAQFENRMQRLRFLQGLQLSVTVDIIKYCPGGGITTTCCLFKVPDSRSDSEKQTSAVSNMLKVQSQFPEYHTRFMKRQFKQRLENVASIQPALLDMIYKDLTLDATTVSHPDTQQRLRMIFMGEVGLLADLRKLNPGRPSGTFDLFFAKLGELVEEFTAADDRRHNEAHMSQILSLKDLIQQAKDRCPENTDIPSSSLVRLQFTPRNPYANTAMRFTSKLPVQYKIQRRQLRVSHPDEHFTNAQFKYLRSLAVRMGKTCSLFCCDDKAKVPIGEPDVALSTGVRGKMTITPSTSTLVAADHDMHHKGCLTPSVYFRCTVPESVDKSFYKGHVTTIINDSVLQSSNPMRHAASVIKLVKGIEDKPTVILKFTDGGTDHRNNLEHVKCASICMFKELDLDMYIAARCAPGHSWTNPAERVMSILNVGLQNCALSRTKGSEETEAQLKKCGSMDAIRKATAIKPELKEEWEMSVAPVRKVIEERFRRLSLKDEPIQVIDPLGEEEIDILKGNLNHLFPSMDTNKLVKSATSKVESYMQWQENHCRQRHYCFQIKKCSNPDCCSPPTQTWNWLPDPVLDEGGEKYKSFDALYGLDTTEHDRPTLQKVKEPTKTGKRNKATKQPVTSPANPVGIVLQDPELINGDASVYTAQNARFTAKCSECSKHRLIYSKLKLDLRYRVQIELLLLEYDYTCGSAVTPPGHGLHGKIFTRLNIDCASPMETAYYSSIHYSSEIARADCCYYCGDVGATVDQDLKLKFKTVYPLCLDCKTKGFNFCCLRPFGKRK